MLTKTPKPKVCKMCKDRFVPSRPLQAVCSYVCAMSHSKSEAAKLRKVEKKEKLEKLKTKSMHLNELQKIFNRFIRLRDEGKGCISCGTKANVQYAAGHYFTVGSSPGLRFDEDNVHLQCNMNCNMQKSGNTSHYAANLVERIGRERFEALQSRRGLKMHLSIPEIEDMKKQYNAKIKELKSSQQVK